MFWTGTDVVHQQFAVFWSVPHALLPTSSCYPEVFYDLQVGSNVLHQQFAVFWSEIDVCPSAAT